MRFTRISYWSLDLYSNPVFQFSLWDSYVNVNRSLSRCRGRGTFNSLYEIRMFLRPHSIHFPTSFNSLYEIQKKDKDTSEGHFCKVLSILFMRFDRFWKELIFACLTFNSLYEIPLFSSDLPPSDIALLSILFMRFDWENRENRGCWRSIQEGSFNSLYEIRDDVWDPVWMEALRPHFQFSLWDSETIY